MLVGARLNWLLAHGKKGWAADTQFIQLDIEPQEIDSNRPIAVPVVGDIASSMQGMLAELKQNTFTTPLVWRDILNIHKQQNAQKMHEKLSTDTQPLNYFNALSAVRDVLRCLLYTSITSLPSAVLVFNSIERLLLLSMVK